MFYSVYIPVNNEKPYLKPQLSEYTAVESKGIEIPVCDIDILYPLLTLHVLVQGNINDIINYEQCSAEIFALDDDYRSKFQCLNLKDAEAILNLLLKRKYYLWNKKSLASK